MRYNNRVLMQATPAISCPLIQIGALSRLVFKSPVFKPVVLAVSASTLLGGNPIAMAQQPVLEEVVVTAQKREETNQNVPISITALTRESLTKQRINNSSDLIGKVPGVAGFEAPGSKGSTEIAMRGMAGGSPASLSQDPAVATYIDGVFLGKQLASSMDVAEIERVEVLRGPQGTLYGRNSTAGAINFITRQPSGEFGVRAIGNLGDYGYRSIKLNMDLPSVGRVGEGAGALSASLGYQRRKRDALYDNDSIGQGDFDTMDRAAWRMALKWEPSERFMVDYVYDYSELDENNALEQVVGFTPVDAALTVPRISTLESVLQGAQYWASVPGTDPRISQRWIPSLQRTIVDYKAAEEQGQGRASSGHSDHSPYTEVEVKGHALTLSWNLDDSTLLRSITGYRKVEDYVYGDLEDIDSRIDANGVGSYNDLLHLTLAQLYGATGGFDPKIPQLPFDALWNAADTIGAFHSKQDTTSDYKQFSQELQLVGSTEQLDYVLGLYYFKDDGEYRRNAIFAAPLTGTAAQYYDNSTEARAAFVQGTWRPGGAADRFSFTLGLRYTEEDKEIDWNYPAYYSPFAGPLPARIASNDKDFDNVSGNFTIAYQVTDEFNAYLRYATGYRSGGFNGEEFNTPAFEEETIEEWEVGVKSDWWNGRLRVNGSLYQYVWDDIQTGVIFTDDTGATSTGIINAGKADRWGGELEILVAPVQDMVISLSYAYVNGDFDKFPDVCGTNVPPTCISGVKNAKRLHSPSNQLNFSGDYVFARTTIGEVTGFVSVSWQDEWYELALWSAVDGATGLPVVYPHQVMDERTLVSGRLSLEKIPLGSGSMRISLWGDNLTDDDYPLTAINFGALGIITERYGAPRTWGVEVAYEY